MVKCSEGGVGPGDSLGCERRAIQPLGSEGTSTGRHVCGRIVEDWEKWNMAAVLMVLETEDLQLGADVAGLPQVRRRRSCYSRFCIPYTIVKGYTQRK